MAMFIKFICYLNLFLKYEDCHIYILSTNKKGIAYLCNNQDQALGVFGEEFKIPKKNHNCVDLIIGIIFAVL